MKVSNAKNIPPVRFGVNIGLVGTHVGLVETRVGSARVFRYHHVGIGKAKWSFWESPTRIGSHSGGLLALGCMVTNGHKLYFPHRHQCLRNFTAL